MQRPTAHSTRIVTEGCVVALVQGKIDALEAKIDDGDFDDGTAGAIALGEAKAKIGALQTVIGGLRFVPDAALEAGGNFPIAEAYEA